MEDVQFSRELSSAYSDVPYAYNKDARLDSLAKQIDKTQQKLVQDLSTLKNYFPGFKPKVILDLTSEEAFERGILDIGKWSHIQMSDEEWIEEDLLQHEEVPTLQIAREEF